MDSKPDVIKGGVQVVTPNEPPDPNPPSSWGTAVPSVSPSPSPSPSQSPSVSPSPSPSPSPEPPSEDNSK